MNLPEPLKPLCNKHVAVFGNGVSGRAVVDVLRALGVGYKVYDEHPGRDVHTVFGAGEAYAHDLVVFSPGFSMKHPWLEAAKIAGCELLGELDFGALFWHGGIVAITGTNGKTTLTEFLTQALKNIGFHSIAVGNIGHPCARLFEVNTPNNAIAVCEVSSFQAEHLKYFRPQALLWTNFDEDHLDRHATMEAYFEAKLNLVHSLGRPLLVVGRSVVDWAERLGKKLPDYTVVANRNSSEVELSADSGFSTYPQQENYLIARKYWELEGYDIAAFQATAQSFVPPKHRLEAVASIGEVSFWNDSKATNFASTLAALETYEEPVFWIGGGKSKGGDLIDFAKRISHSIKEAFLIGETGPKLKDLLNENGVAARCFVTLEEAVVSAFAQIQGKAAVVLSPGFSSQDMYPNYAQRGLIFEQVVNEIKNNDFNEIKV